MIASFLGLPGDYTKHSCFLCLWNSRADEQHYLVKNWPARKDLTPGSHNVLNSSLIEISKILLPPLHINPNQLNVGLQRPNKFSNVKLYTILFSK